MKAPVLGLAVATIAFAGSSFYLWSQLKAERELGARMGELSRQLNERVAELERARGNPEHLRPFSAPAPAGAVSVLPLPAGHESDVSDTGTQSPGSVVDASSPGLSAAHQKMMLGQFRANTRRMLADLGTELGLSKDQEKKLIDLISDYQLAGIFSGGENIKIDDHQAQIVDLIGTERAETLRQYQDSLPARTEVNSIATQLEGWDVPLREDQRRRLIAVVSEERARMPLPEIRNDADQESAQKAMFAWEDDYAERVNGQARGILNTAQYAAYSEYQQWQKDMREQFAVSRSRATRGGAFIAVGAPAATAIAVPAPESSNKK